MPRKEVLAIIPAKGRSTRLPGKNLLEVCGKPLVAYSIEEAKKSKHITRLMVSTGEERIVDIARKYGVEIPYLEEASYTMQDNPLVPDLFNYTRHRLKELDGYDPDFLVMLQPTSPLRKAEHIDQCIEAAFNADADYVATVSESPIHPYRTRFIKDGFLKPVIDSPILFAKFQDLPKAYFFNGAVYVTRPISLNSGLSLVNQTWRGVIMPGEDAIDIDTLPDLLTFKSILEARKNESTK